MGWQTRTYGPMSTSWGEILSTIAMPEIVKGNFCLKGFFKHIQNMIENEQAKGLEVGAFILSASPTQA